MARGQTEGNPQFVLLSTPAIQTGGIGLLGDRNSGTRVETGSQPPREERGENKKDEPTEKLVHHHRNNRVAMSGL